MVFNYDILTDPYLKSLYVREGLNKETTPETELTDEDDNILTDELGNILIEG
jgi:hypothetical protein